jgi:hypothetical protein
MLRNVMLKSAGTSVGLAAAMSLVVLITGCRVNVNKGANGEDKTVQVDTPFGGVHVNTDQTSATDLGLPAYPGAIMVTDGDKHKSADVHLGFGEWELRVRAVSYSTPDKQDQVLAFYKKALGRYGEVITCKDKAAIGTPVATSEGLTCDEDHNAKVQVDQGDYSLNRGSLELKAGSKRHQHIVGFEEPKDGKTHFALVALDLPAFNGKDGDSGN